jgi:recombination protein RecA
MAKKKNDETTELTIDDFVGRLRKEIDSEFGKGVFKNFQEVVDKKLAVVPWTKSLNDGVGGGVLEGSFVSVSGGKKLGKTTSLLTLAANAQAMGKCVFYLSVEARLKSRDLKGIQGLDASPDKLVIIESTPERILSTQDFLNIAEKIIKTYPGCMIIIDSISALADQKELDGGLGTMTRGHNQQVISQFINNVSQIVSANKIILCGIVHIIANTSGFGASTVEKQPNRWGYQSDYILKVKYCDKWRVGNAETGSIIGQIMHWECATSALGIPFTTFDSYLRYGVGIDDMYEHIQAAIGCGLITKSGSWYELVFLANHTQFLEKEGEEYKIPKKQGSEKIWDFMKENPEIYATLKKELAVS